MSKTARIHTGGAKPKRVPCYGEFTATIGGQAFALVITRDVGMNLAVTHKSSGMKVCTVACSAQDIPAYSKLTTDEARARFALQRTVDVNGEARVRSVLVGAPDLP